MKAPEKELPADDHEVGYRKPPAHSRFRKGQSGNPGGRPRGMTAGRATALALKETTVETPRADSAAAMDSFVVPRGFGAPDDRGLPLGHRASLAAARPGRFVWSELP
jgi:hypothetical protein